MREAFEAMGDSLQRQLAEQQIAFSISTCPTHFGGVWEREIKAVKVALRVVLGDQVVTEAVLCTVLIEMEDVLNSNLLGYVSSTLADLYPVTTNILLMGRCNTSLTQAMYATGDTLGNRQCRQSHILFDHFWVNFVRNYLPDLQVRKK